MQILPRYKEPMDRKVMAANQILFKILMLLLTFSFLIGIGASGNLPIAEPTKAPSTTDENHQPQDHKIAEEGFKIRAEVDLATADVTVIGTPSAELRAEDFILFDNNVAQQISYFSRDQLPLAIAILIDKSGSTLPYLPVLQIAGITALRRLKPEDQVALFGFDQGFEKLSDLTEDRLQIADKIGQIQLGGITNIYDPLFNAAKYLKKTAPQRRHSIILISDNAHNYTGNHDAKQCRVELLETATTLHNIRIPNDREDMDIRELAEETGGEVLEVEGPTSLKAALDNAIVRLRMQYTLGFNPSNPGKTGSFHKLDVRFAHQESCPGCQLLVRGGYYAGVTAPLPPKGKTGTTPHHSPQNTDEILVQRSILIAGTSRLDLDEISFTASTTEQMDSSSQPQVKIEMQIDPAEIEAPPVGEKRPTQMIVAIFYSDDKGALLGSNLWRIEGRPNENNANREPGEPIPFSAKIPLKTPNQRLKIVVYDETSDKVGSKSMQLNNRAKQDPGP
jgi:Ca-activated chloride channel homolog